MAERRTIGQILMSFGRITEDDVNDAIAYQKSNGGYFGEALLALGLVSQDELEWGLASQFDLPYVFPDADSIDPEAAALVSPEWALSNLTLPIMRTADTLTVVVDSPIKTDAVDELAKRTELDIQLGLASSSAIRDLIRQVYARAAAASAEDTASTASVAEVFQLTLEACSLRFGISARGHRAWAWWEDSGAIRRRPLEGTWHTELDQLVTPSPSGSVGDERRAEWEADLKRGGVLSSTSVHYLADESGAEYLFKPLRRATQLEERFPPPASGILSEVRILARSGAARFAVTGDEALGREILPHLPTLLLESSWRSIYLTDPDSKAADEAFSVELPPDEDDWAEELDSIRAFHFDVVTVDLPGHPEKWLQSALDIAAVAFVRWPDDADRSVAHEAGLRWVLHLEPMDGGRIDWSLEPLRG